MIAVIETGGKQYRVEPGTTLRVEKIAGSAGDKISFDKVLLLADGADVKIGAPFLPKIKAEAVVLRQGRTRKEIVFHYHSKTRKRTKNTHREYFTEVRIEKISA
ncbi:MAG: 50S ribosomal protein L21 [Patescibacteria group bacterium]|nr:50S ribosomal protein L21 [Patescibacteria group bacterium]